jgi:hypothetical protein
MPSAALVKALLINGADPLPGQYTPSETGTIPNFDQGFGRVNLAATVSAGGPTKGLQYWDEDKTLDTGQESKFTVGIQSPANTMKITLVWTDPPGDSLQNDLDLIVTTATGAVALGNAALGSDVPDRTNNVEQVTLTNMQPGNVTITVRAFRIAVHQQSFALVVRSGN